VRQVDYGVFLPVGNGGFLPSVTAPAVPGDYLYNRRVVRLAEDVGLGFVVSMARWRGFGGPSEYNERCLESITASAGLAEATEAIRIFATIHTAAVHPAVAAKMISTIDQISAGRIGINVVAGSNPVDHGQMGLWRDVPHDELYSVAEEWVTVVKRLWSEPRVDYTGKYFTLTDCVSDPKPSQQPHPPLLCAATSDTGIRFTSQYANASLVNGSTFDSLVENGRRVKKISAEAGAPTKSVGLVMVVAGDTDAEAQERVDHYNAGADAEAIAAQVWMYSASAREFGTAQVRQRETQTRAYDEKGAPRAVSASAAVGTADTIAARIAEIIREGEYDAIGMYFPDYIHDLEHLGLEILPRLARLGYPRGRTI
jgi:pyrimidine oxygenase